MALIGRLFVIFFGFLAACLVAGMIVVFAVLFPELSDLDTGTIDQNAVNVVLGFGFIFISGFALLPAMLVVLITEAFCIRGMLTYALGGAVVGILAVADTVLERMAKLEKITPVTGRVAA